MKTLLPKSIKRPLWELINPRLYPRRFHAYALGLPKTGTTSMKGICIKSYRANHEPDKIRLINAQIAFQQHKMTEAEVMRFLRKRDRYLWLEMESSYATGPIVRIFARTFREARFVVTVREPLSWIDSAIQTGLERRQRGLKIFAAQLFEATCCPRTPPVFSPEEQVLKDHDLYSLDQWLTTWTTFYKGVFETVPADRMLVIRTKNISKSVDRIADFLEVPASSLDASRSHLHKTRKTHGLLEQIDKEFLDAKVSEHCGDLVDLYLAADMCEGQMQTR